MLSLNTHTITTRRRVRMNSETASKTNDRRALANQHSNTEVTAVKNERRATGGRIETLKIRTN